MSLRTLQRRVVKLKKGLKRGSSPFIIMYGSFDAFADASYAEVEAGKQGGDCLPIFDILRAWAWGAGRPSSSQCVRVHMFAFSR